MNISEEPGREKVDLKRISVISIRSIKQIRI